MESNCLTAREKYAVLSLQTSGYFECQLPVLGQTDKAIQFDNYAGHLDKSHGVWIPKSQMEILEMGEAGTRYFVKNWLSAKLK